MKFGKGFWKTFSSGIEREWVITNGLGSYAGSSIIGAHTRKHQGMLIASLHPPVERYLVFSKINESVKIGTHEYSLFTNQRPGNWNEEGQRYLQRFTQVDVPTFTYCVEGVMITKTIAFEWEKNTIAIGYEIHNTSHPTTLSLTPLFNYRDHHGRSERAELNFTHSKDGQIITLQPEKNESLSIRLYTSEGTIHDSKEMYDSDMVLQTEIDTGMTAIDNHFTPYTIDISVAPYETKNYSIICTIEDTFEKDAFVTIKKYQDRIQALQTQAGFTDSFANILIKASDQFITKRDSTGYKTILAGLPWFTDWGRDTMIALQGLTLVTNRLDDAKGILRTFANYVKNGLVPNMFPDEGLEPLYNTVDASLWYFYSVHKYLEYAKSQEALEFIQNEIYPKLEEIIAAYKNGTDFSIYMDTDGLIHAGGGLDQVTWMDVRVGEWVVTPRHGKPVEINALWYNALKVMEDLSSRFGKDPSPYGDLAVQVSQSFLEKFWNESTQCLYDVVDEMDPKVRPNQIWAVSLPYTMLPREKEELVVSKVLSELYVGCGLRSLSPFDPEYIGTYFGKLHDRDAAYHQGTSWAFPIGGFITAYVKVHDHSPESIAFARKLLAPMEDHLYDGCVGSIAEIFDGNEPNISRGCYAQAWSVGEVLRAYAEDILAYEK